MLNTALTRQTPPITINKTANKLTNNEEIKLSIIKDVIPSANKIDP